MVQSSTCKMTRFAKRGFHNKKLNEATPWTQLKQSRRGEVKDRKREDRRLKRQTDRALAKVCFSCRGKGHMVSECPFLSEANQQNSCYKCGSTEHTASSCSSKVAKGSYPFAQCFICGEQGHISKQCPDNPRGLYPKGGCCKQCGSVEHLRKDCPQFLEKKGIKQITLDVMKVGDSVDAQEVTSSTQATKVTEKERKMQRIVKF